MIDWGAGNALSNGGGPLRIYLNDGSGHFTAAAAPAQLIRFSWDMTLVDVDNDWDLDIVVSSKGSPQSYLFTNDGQGAFTLQPNALPKFTNNYALEPMDVDGDGYIDLATINDGSGSTSHLFINQRDGTYADETATRLTGAANPGADDNAVVFLDVDNDGDADMLYASLSGPERLVLNDGSGHFTLAAGSATPNDTPGSLGIAVGDLNGDGRLDVVQSQGEVDFPEKVELATNAVSVDTQPPVVRVEQVYQGAAQVRARVHDHQSPSRIADWKSVVLKAGASEIAMHWYGEYLWSGDLPPGFSGAYQVCATDRNHNMACASGNAGPPYDDSHGDAPPDAGGNPDNGSKSGGCCDTGSSAASLFAPLLVLLVIYLRTAFGGATRRASARLVSARIRSRGRGCDSRGRRRRSA
jgi:hypothetical protein